MLGLRFGLFIVELEAGLWSQSLSLLAGAGHLFSDLLTLGLTLLVLWLVQHKPASDPNHYQELEAWVALLNGLSLGAIALMIAWQAMQHLHTSQTILALPMLIAATLSLVFNGLITYLLQGEHHHNLSVRGVFLHGVADAASSLGVMLSALAIYYWHWLWADAAASLFVAALIGWSTISLLQDSFKALVNARRNALG